MHGTRSHPVARSPRLLLTAFVIASLAFLQLPPLANIARAAVGQVFLPNITKTLGGPNGWTTPIVVQNTGPAPTDVTISLYRFSDGSPAATEKSPSLKPGQSWSFDPRSDTKLSDNTQFSAVVQAASGSVTAVVLEGSETSWMAYSGTSTGASTVYLPNITRRLGGPGGWDTPFIVQNLGAQPTTASVSFYSFSDGALAKKIDKVTLQPGRAQPFLTWAIDGLMDDQQYSVVIQGPPGSELYAVVNESSGIQAMSYEGLLSGSQVVYLPNVLKFLGGVDHWSTPFIVQNVGPAPTTFTLEFYSFDSGRLVTRTPNIPLSSGRSFPVDVRFYPADLPAGSYSVVVRGAQGGQLGAVVNEMESSAGMAMSYDGFSQAQPSAYLPIVQKTVGGPNWTSSVIAQNLAPAPADITISLFDSRGELASQRVFANVGAGAAAVYDPRADRRLPPGTYSAIVQAPTAVSAVVNILGTVAGDYAMAYGSTPGAATQVVSPTHGPVVMGTMTFAVVTGNSADVYIDQAINAVDAARIASLADADVARVETDFGRQFTAIPRIYALSTDSTYAQALQAVLGYSPEEATLKAKTSSGIYSPKAQSVLVNWGSVAEGLPVSTIRHELTHLMLHTAIGTNPTFPAWFDEGSATLEEQTMAGSQWLQMLTRYGAASMADTGTLYTLEQLRSPVVWSSRVGSGSMFQYFEAAEAVRLLRADLGAPAILRILDLMSGGTPFDDAYATVAGKPMAEFAETLPTRLKGLATTYPGIATATDSYVGPGLTFIVYGFLPLSSLQIEVLSATDGSNKTVTTTQFGTAWFYLGKTWSAGEYNIRATGTTGSVSVIAYKAP